MASDSLSTKAVKMGLSPMKRLVSEILVNSMDGLDLIVEVPKRSFIDLKCKMQ